MGRAGTSCHNVRWIGRQPLVVGVAVAVALACASAEPASASTGRGNRPALISAINGFSLYKAPAVTWGIQLAGMQAHGIKMVRSDAPWADIEPAPPGVLGHIWQFAQIDAWVLALAEHHLTWQPIVDYSTPWAKSCSEQFCPPDSDATFAAFAQALARRYGDHGTFWAQHRGVPYLPAAIFEIWNEENGPVPAARYAALYLAARTAIRSVDPHASVIVGGLGDDSTLRSFDRNKDYPAWYVLRMLIAAPQLKGHIDGFGLHPYAPNATVAMQWVVDLRHALTVWGFGATPIDITEAGWMTGGPDGEAWRATQMRYLALWLAGSNCGIRVVAPYDWINPAIENEPNDFGFVDRTGLDTSLRPGGSGWFSGLAQAAKRPTVNLCASTVAPAKSARGGAHHQLRRKQHHRHRRHQRPDLRGA